MKTTERARRFSLEYRSFDPDEPRWLVRVVRSSTGPASFLALPPHLDNTRMQSFPTIAQACDYARAQTPLEAP